MSMKTKRTTVIALVLTVLVFGGCSTTGQKGSAQEGTTAAGAEVSDASIQAAQEGTESAAIQGASEGGSWEGSALEDPDSLLYTKTIYFAFDSSEVEAKYRDVIAAHGEYLASHPAVTVRIEGNCDERGSREYNIGLGERRADAVKRLLEANGAARDQLTVISYGEERPVASGQNEDAWALNRRVDLVY